MQRDSEGILLILASLFGQYPRCLKSSFPLERRKKNFMKKLTSKLIIALYILMLGFIAFVLFNPQVGATPSYYIVKHTNVDCYERNGSWMSFCRSFTVTTAFPVQPWSGHENEAVHASHYYTSDDVEYGSATRIYSSCSYCY